MKTKRLSFILSYLMVVMVISGAPVHPLPVLAQSALQTSGTSLVLKTSNLVAAPGSEFDVDVIIQTAQPSRGAQVELRFDPALVEVIGVSEGSFYQSWAKANQATTMMIPNPPVIDNQNGLAAATGVAILGGKAGLGPIGSGIFLT